MKNYLQHGDTLPMTAPSGGVVGGTPYMIGSLFGVAMHDADEAASFEMRLQGVFNLPKTTGQVWAEGDVLYWDAATSKLTKTAGANRRVAVAAAAALTAATVGSALLLAAPGQKIVCGQHTTVAASDTVVTGLASVAAVVASLDSDPVAGCQEVTASIGDQAGAPAAGSILIKTWKATAAGDTALIAATTFTRKVNYIAVGS